MWKFFENCLALFIARTAVQCRLNQIGQALHTFPFHVSRYNVLCAVSIDAYQISFTFLLTFHAFLWMSHWIYTERKYALLLLISSHFILRSALKMNMTSLFEPYFRSYIIGSLMLFSMRIIPQLWLYRNRMGRH